MLDRDISSFGTNVETPAATAPAVASKSLTPALGGMFKSSYSEIVGKFEQELGFGILPNEATTGCTVANGNIKFGEDLKQDAGDYLIVEPLNLTPYQKLGLGVSSPTQDEAKLQVNCYNGETVVFDEVEYSKAEFLALVKEKGYSKARWDDRAVLHANYLTCDRAGKVEMSDDDRLMAVYLSPSSYKEWKGFLIKSAARDNGMRQLKLTKVQKSFGNNSWTAFGFERTSYTEQDAA